MNLAWGGCIAEFLAAPKYPAVVTVAVNSVVVDAKPGICLGAARGGMLRAEENKNSEDVGFNMNLLLIARTIVPRYMQIMVALWSLAVALLGTSTTTSATPLERADAKAQAPSWHQYVRSPSSDVVKPAKILADQTKGDVSNADGLITGKGPTVLTRKTKGDTAPSIVVDFGQNVVGLLGLTFAGSTNGTDGFPGLRLTFSETMEFLTDRSDYTRSYNAGGVSLSIN